MQLWFSVEDAVDARVLEAAKAMRSAGFVCCLASNQEPHRAKYMKEAIRFSTNFDHLFFSGEKALDLSGEQIAFWDDSPAHIEAAKQRGWSAELYTDYKEFQRQAAALPGTKTNWQGK